MSALKADWPCTKGKEIDSAYFEDLRKILWGFNKLGYGIDQGVTMKDGDGNWIYDAWSPLQTYHAGKCCGTLVRWSTVIYLDKTKKELVPYRNTSHVSPNEPPPPENGKWLRIARKDVYCDYFPNKDIWNLGWATWGEAYGYHTGLSRWKASWNFPACLNKFHQQTVSITDTQWEADEFYHFGNIVKAVAAKSAIRYWCKVPHFAVKATGAPQWADKDYAAKALTMHHDKMYIATESVWEGESAPDVSRKWARAGYHTDEELWGKTSLRYEDNITLPADSIYSKSQERPIAFRGTFLSGPIGPRYRWSTEGTDIPFYRPYHISGGLAAKSGHRDADMKASVHYQSYIENFCDRYDSVFCGVNPQFDLNSPDDYQPFLEYDDCVWKCNLSGFEACLDEIGHYDWYLDVLYPPQTTKYGSQILATWRRMWKYTYGYPKVLTYDVEIKDENGKGTGEMEKFPLVWPQEKGPPPFQEYCCKSNGYDYNFWRKGENVLKAYRQATSQLTDKDRERVAGRHEITKNYELNHQLVQDMYDVLMTYKYVMIDIGKSYSRRSYSLSGAPAYFSSFGELKAYMQSHPGGWVASAGHYVGWEAGAHGNIVYLGRPYTYDYEKRWPTTAGLLGYTGWPSNRSQFWIYRAGFSISSGTKAEMDEFIRKYPCLRIIIRYEGIHYYDPPIWFEQHTDERCFPPQIISQLTKSIIPSPPAVSGVGFHYSSTQRLTTAFVTATKRERVSDWEVVYYLEPTEGSCFGAFSQVGGLQEMQPLPGVDFECPAAQTELIPVFDYTRTVVIDKALSVAAFEINPVQPLGCTPLS